ncbi:hypothetical protein [Micromonospora sp. NPDC005806]|uniref:hypothetical protein n=1 Tax=Micromonospora sp. NPDC005806 TaxID=3364234 RepID=UPI0036914727
MRCDPAHDDGSPGIDAEKLECLVQAVEYRRQGIDIDNELIPGHSPSGTATIARWDAD